MMIHNKDRNNQIHLRDAIYTLIANIQATDHTHRLVIEFEIF